MKIKYGNRVREILCKRRINEINNLIKNFVDDSTLLPLYCAKYTTLNKLDKLQSDIFICISKDYQLLLASKQVLDDGKTFNDLKLKLECDITGYISVFMENIISTRANIINI